MKKLLLLIVTVFLGWQMHAQPSWTESNSGIINSNKGYIREFHIVNSQVAWASATSINGTSSVTSREITKTTDGGTTWTANNNLNLSPLINGGLSNVCGIDGNTAFVAAYKNSIGNGGVWKTTDGGATWTKVSSSSMYTDAASFPNFVYFWDANNGMVQGDPVSGEYEIYITSDGGQTWQQVPGSDIPNPEAADDYGVVYGYETAGNTLWFKTRYGRIYKTTDMGHTWTKFTTPVAGVPAAADKSNYPEFTFKDDNEGWIVDYDTADLYHTTDGGTTWNQVTHTGSMKKSEISVVPGTNMIVTAGSSNNNFGTAYSTDAGASWTEIDQQSHTSLGFLNNSVGYSGRFKDVNEERTIWVWHPDPATINENAIEGLKAFPNPVHDVVSVSTSKSEIAQISIYDITGKEVLHLNKLSGYQVQVNTSQLENGVYLLKVTDNNNAQQTIKLVVK